MLGPLINRIYIISLGYFVGSVATFHKALSVWLKENLRQGLLSRGSVELPGAYLA